jgi:hypothetical protein
MNSNKTEVFSTTMSSGSVKRQWVCLTTDCYKVQINASDVEIGWEMEVSDMLRDLSIYVYVTLCYYV